MQQQPHLKKNQRVRTFSTWWLLKRRQITSALKNLFMVKVKGAKTHTVDSLQHAAC
jgi:ribosomal protein L23